MAAERKSDIVVGSEVRFGIRVEGYPVGGQPLQMDNRLRHAFSAKSVALVGARGTNG
jgi:hypothetical protein